MKNDIFDKKIISGISEYAEAMADLEALKSAVTKISFLGSYCCDFGLLYDIERLASEEKRACHNSSTQTVLGITTGIILDIKWNDNEKKAYVKVLCQGKVHHTLASCMTIDILHAIRETTRLSNRWTESEVESFSFMRGNPFFLKIINGHLILLEPLRPHLYEKVAALAETLYETNFDFLNSY